MGSIIFFFHQKSIEQSLDSPELNELLTEQFGGDISCQSELPKFDPELLQTLGFGFPNVLPNNFTEVTSKAPFICQGNTMNK